MTGTPEGSTESGFMEKPGIEPATPGLQGIALIHYTTGASHQSKREKTHFCGSPMGRNQYWAGTVYDLCVYYLTGTPKGSTERHSAYPLHHGGLGLISKYHLLENFILEIQHYFN